MSWILARNPGLFAGFNKFKKFSIVKDIKIKIIIKGKFSKILENMLEKKIFLFKKRTKSRQCEFSTLWTILCKEKKFNYEFPEEIIPNFVLGIGKGNQFRN